MTVRHDEGCHEKSAFACFLVCEELSNDDGGVEKGNLISGDTSSSELDSKMAISIKKCWGGATVERLGRVDIYLPQPLRITNKPVLRSRANLGLTESKQKVWVKRLEPQPGG